MVLTTKMRHCLSVIRAVGAVLAMALISWAVGLAAYRIALLAFFHETPSPGDWRAVVAWSAIASAISLLPVVSTTLALRLRMESRNRWAVTPIVVALVAVGAGTLLMGTVWRGRALSPETLLLTILFASTGASFAIGLELLMTLSERKLRADGDSGTRGLEDFST